MQEFEPSSRLVDGIVGVRGKFETCRRDCRSSSSVRGLQSGLQEQFETCRRDCRSSSPVRGLESGLQEFERSSRLVVRIVGV